MVHVVFVNQHNEMHTFKAVNIEVAEADAKNLRNLGCKVVILKNEADMTCF